MHWMIWTLLLSGAAQAQKAPKRQVPVSVLVEVEQLENRFEIALADDCNNERCFPKGCAYVDHAVADRPRSRSLPGLPDDMGPGSVETQDYLTRAQCGFAYEESLQSEDVAALSRRIEAKLSKGWLVVSVGHEKLQPLPAYVQEPPAPEVPEEEPVEEVEPQPIPWTSELWAALLPHFYWMLGLMMATVAGITLIWAYRRVGATSIEDQMLLAELARGDGGAPAEVPARELVPDEGDAGWVAAQHEVWRTRLEGEGDREVQALVRSLLRAGELPLLAQAVLRFPDRLPSAFPEGGDLAAAKLDLSDYLQTVDPDSLPDDAEFFRALNRHALSAALAAQSDARIVQSLRQDFGAAGLASLIGSLPARPGAVLFALAPATEQHEMVRLFSANQTTQLAQQLLLSNRMDPAEAAWLFEVIESARTDAPRPPAPPSEVTDRGSEFDAVGALAVLLPGVAQAQRSQLFAGLIQHFGGTVPAWYRGIIVPEMLDSLPTESRIDLLLEVEVEPLAAWLSLVDTDTRKSLTASMPDALRASLSSFGSWSSKTRQLSMASRGRAELAGAFQRQLARSGVAFEQVLVPSGGQPG